MVYNELTKLPVFVIAITAARMHHAVTSSFAALAMAMVPKWVLDNPFSCTILANTGKAVILIEIPINNAKERKSVCLAANSSYTK